MPVRPLVLAAIDASRDTEAVVRHAAVLARACGADLHAIQVVSRSGGLWSAPRHELRLRERLRALRTDMASDDVSFRVVTLRGARDAAVAAYAQLKGARLIVVGAHHGSSRAWRRSSVARRLARMSPVPVLVVPPSANAHASSSWRRIVVAVDFSPSSTMALRTALDIARPRGAAVTLFHAIASPREMVFTGGEALRMLEWLRTETKAVEARLERMAASLGASHAQAVALSGDPYRGLLRTADESGAALVVVGASPRTRLHEVVFGSTLRAVLRRARVPVLVVPVSASGQARSEDEAGTDRPGGTSRVVAFRRRAA